MQTVFGVIDRGKAYDAPERPSGLDVAKFGVLKPRSSALGIIVAVCQRCGTDRAEPLSLVAGWFPRQSARPEAWRDRRRASHATIYAAVGLRHYPRLLTLLSVIFGPS